MFYDVSNGGLASVDKMYRRLKVSHPEITRKQVTEFAKLQEVNQVFKPKKVVKYYPLSSYTPLQRVQIDLLDVSNDSSQNRKGAYLF